MGMTLNDFEAKALQVLLSQRFLSLPLFEEEELSEYHIADNQGEMNLEDFIRQYAEVITEQFKADYENRLKADLVAMLEELDLTIDEISIVTRHGVTGTVMTAQGMRKKIKENIQHKINALKEPSNDD